MLRHTTWGRGVYLALLLGGITACSTPASQADATDGSPLDSRRSEGGLLDGSQPNGDLTRPGEQGPIGDSALDSSPPPDVANPDDMSEPLDRAIPPDAPHAVDLPAASDTLPGCHPWRGAAASGSLQAAVSAYTCVEIQRGRFTITSPVTVPEGHTVRGVDAIQSVLVADQATWKLQQSDAMFSDTTAASAASNPFVIADLTLDGAGVATYNICCRGFIIRDSILENSRCSAVGIAGRGVSILRNTMRFSAQHTVVPGRNEPVTCATGGLGGVDEGAAIYSPGKGDNHAPLIEGNTIHDSYGPALDVNGAWGGVFRNNKVFDNSAWAAIALYGASNWLIEGNTIDHPANEPPQPYHPYCATGPAPHGGNSAGIFLCQDTDADSLVTNDNTIRDNQTSSFYGILSVGADEVQPYLAPRNNTFSGNDVRGSVVGCADDFKDGQWFSDHNTWANNNCDGTADSPPIFF